MVKLINQLSSGWCAAAGEHTHGDDAHMLMFSRCYVYNAHLVLIKHVSMLTFDNWQLKGYS